MSWSENTVIELYQTGKSITEIARICHTYYSKIRRTLVKHGIEIDSTRNKPWNRGLRGQVKYVQRTIELVENGEYRQLSEDKIRKHIKRYLIKTNGHRCQICGVEEWNGEKVPLVCDHINGDSSNNDLTNFRVICRNCDGQLPTFVSKNRGRGREYQRRYRRG